VTPGERRPPLPPPVGPGYGAAVARLHQRDSDRSAVLPARCLVGRAPECDLRPDERTVSARASHRLTARRGLSLPRHRVKDVRVVIRDINPVLRGWGNYFRTGNAAVKFKQVDEYVQQRLRSFMVKRKGRNLHAGEVLRWDHDFFHAHGLYRLRGTIKYPEAA
jgi:hypothetical protein